MGAFLFLAPICLQAADRDPKNLLFPEDFVNALKETSKGGTFRIATANDVPERDPLEITIEGSDDAEAGASKTVNF